MGELRTMGSRGDTKVTWDPQNEHEVEAARETFETMVGGRSFIAFSVAKTGDQGERVTEFDPDAAQVILVPPMAGGA